MGKNSIFRVQETGASSVALLQEACNNTCCQPKRIAAALYTFMPRHCCFFFVPPFCFFVLQPLFAFGLCSGDTGVYQEFWTAASTAALSLLLEIWKIDCGRMQGTWPGHLLRAGVCLTRSRRSSFLFLLCFGLCLSFGLTFSCLFLLNFHFLYVIRSGSHTSHSVET